MPTASCAIAQAQAEGGRIAKLTISNVVTGDLQSAEARGSGGAAFHSRAGCSSRPTRNSIITTPNSAKCRTSVASRAPTIPSTGPITSACDQVSEYGAEPQPVRDGYREHGRNEVHEALRREGPSACASGPEEGLEIVGHEPASASAAVQIDAILDERREESGVVPGVCFQPTIFGRVPTRLRRVRTVRGSAFDRGGRSRSNGARSARSSISFAPSAV